ncbi:MAG: M23 family metallopeptidase [Oscillospiraceae bacterium]|nr:M23 family metallopeptidase [Oscillospiraceae bacterium]
MENNNKHSGEVRHFFQERGYYILLLLLLAAVAVSGIWLVRSAMLSSRQEAALATATTDAALSVPNTAKTDSQTKPAADTAETFEPVESTDQSVAKAASAITVWPLNGAVMTGYSMDKLVYSDTMGDWRVHNGIDIAATAGQSVRAAAAGTVSSVYDDDFLGTVVVIDVDEDVQMVYANLKAMPTVAVGDGVAVGDTIGAVGDTAISESREDAHLHFAVLRSGEPANPTEYLP